MRQKNMKHEKDSYAGRATTKAMKKKEFHITAVTLLSATLFLAAAAYLFQDKTPCRTERQVRYSFTLKNGTNTIRRNIHFLVYAPVKQTATQVCRKTDASFPYEIVTDGLGNQILCFSFKTFAPYETKIVEIQSSLSMAASADKTHSDIDPSVFLKPEPYVDSIHPDITEKARTFATNRPEETVKALHDWTYTHLRYNGYTADERGARFALRHRSGDCTEYMDLLCALCRASGIPCKRIGGYICNKNSVLKASAYHNWIEFFNGRKWILVDPSNPTFTVNPENYIASRIISSFFRNMMQQNDRFRIIGDGIKATMNI